jgi:penicillin-binding protein 1A
MIKVVKDPLLAMYKPTPFDKLDKRIVKKEFDCGGGTSILPDSLQVTDSELDSLNALLEEPETQPSDTSSASPN